nr:hypothetical protein [uncultured Celeribacter sp.]
MTELTLLLQASNGAPVLALGRDSEILFDSSQNNRFDGSRDYRAMLESGLQAIDAPLSDIRAIGCDIGPGGLGVTRTAAAFANGLAFTLNLPVHALPAFALLGAAVAGPANPARPVVLLRRAARPHVHFGIYSENKLVHYEHCVDRFAFDEITDLTDFDLAGNVPVAGHAAPITNTADMSVLLKAVQSAPKPAPGARAWPIVEVLE